MCATCSSNRLLRAAAVIGYEFDVDLFADVVGRDADDVLEALDTAQTALAFNLLTGGIYCGGADRLRALLLDRLGEHEQADALFADALRQHQDLRSPTWIARTQLDWAESLLRRHRPDAARTHLDSAAATLGDLDLPDCQLRLAELRAVSAAG